MAGATVQFFFGLGSRYSYLASTQIAQLENETACRVQWLPMVSVDLMQRRKQNPFTARTATGDWSGVSISGQYSEQYRETDLKRWADLYGVPFQTPKPARMDERRRTLYCVAAELAGRGAAYCRAMFDAMYVSNIAVGEDDCLRLAGSIDVAPDLLRSHMDSGAAEKRHDEIVMLALSKGALGVPTFVCKDELFWGNDRLILLRDRLTKS